MDNILKEILVTVNFGSIVKVQIKVIKNDDTLKHLNALLFTSVMNIHAFNI